MTKEDLKGLEAGTWLVKQSDYEKFKNYLSENDLPADVKFEVISKELEAKIKAEIAPNSTADDFWADGDAYFVPAKKNES